MAAPRIRLGLNQQQTCPHSPFLHHSSIQSLDKAPLPRSQTPAALRPRPVMVADAPAATRNPPPRCSRQNPARDRATVGQSHGATQVPDRMRKLILTPIQPVPK